MKASFRSLFRNDDTATYQAALRLMEGRYTWLEEGVVALSDVYSSDLSAVASVAPDSGASPAASPATSAPEHAGAD